MNEHDRQTRIDTIRQYVATAAAGISIGAALMIVAPAEVMRLVGFREHRSHGRGDDRHRGGGGFDSRP